MIKTEMIGQRIRHYSDKDMMIRQIETNILYEDAVDVMPCQYSYEETTQKIPQQELNSDEILEKAENAFQNGVNSIN